MTVHSVTATPCVWELHTVATVDWEDAPVPLYGARCMSLAGGALGLLTLFVGIDLACNPMRLRKAPSAMLLFTNLAAVAEAAAMFWVAGTFEDAGFSCFCGAGAAALFLIASTLWSSAFKHASDSFETALLLPTTRNSEAQVYFSLPMAYSQ